jgi:hypothetical protein
MNFDLIYILLIVYLMRRLLKTSGLQDLLVSCFISTLLYSVPKMFLIWIFCGFSIPIIANSTAHFVTGTISFLLIGGAFFYRIKRPLKH